MKTKSYISAILLLSLSLASCEKEEMASINTNEATENMSITVSDNGFMSGSRATTSSDYKVTFQPNDAIGLFVMDKQETPAEESEPSTGLNIKLTLNNEGKWVLPAETNLNSLKGKNIFAYYPHQTDMTGKYTEKATDAEGFFAPLVKGWETSEVAVPLNNPQPDYDFTIYDLMTGSGILNGNSLAISLNHKMGMVVVRPGGKTLTGVTINGVTPYAYNENETLKEYRYLHNPNADNAAKNVNIKYTDGKIQKNWILTAPIAGSYRIYSLPTTTTTNE